MTTTLWMVRAGEGGSLISDFERLNLVAIGWPEVGDLRQYANAVAIREALRQRMDGASSGSISVWAGVLLRFRDSIKTNDQVVSYDPERREYLVGRIDSDYSFEPETSADMPNVRRVTWSGRVSRDALSSSSRNSLGSIVTLFQPGTQVQAELQELLRLPTIVPPDGSTEEDTVAEFEVIRRDVLSRSHEFIKDRILRLGAEEMEELTAALLRAMGYKARVTPRGADRGRDVTASPDGLGFQAPRVIAEVKHRPKEQMGAPQVRGFVGGLREGDRGLYVSTGGFTREARYEADRATVPIALVDLDELASLVVEHYDQFDAEGRSLLPLARVYWPFA